MKSLILIRHAKSSWELTSSDKERSLCNRGVDDALLVSSHIKSFLPKTSIIWSSTAKRARDTATIFLQNMTYPIESIIFKDELYTFELSELAEVIKNCPNSYDCVIVFGHNAAITDFVNKFGDVFIDNVSTSGFVAIDFDTDSWATIDKGHTKKVVFPKDLKT